MISIIEENFFRNKNLLIVTMWFMITFFCFSVVIAQKQYVFRYSHSQPKQHPRSISMIFFKEELEKRSKGKIKVENYFSSVLGTEFEVLDMVATVLYKELVVEVLPMLTRNIIFLCYRFLLRIGMRLFNYSTVTSQKK